MNQIASLLPLDNVVANLDASSKKRVFEQVGILFENHQSVARSTVYDALFAREKLGSTGLGQGIAIPHGRIKGLKAPVGNCSPNWRRCSPTGPFANNSPPPRMALHCTASSPIGTPASRFPAVRT